MLEDQGQVFSSEEKVSFIIVSTSGTSTLGGLKRSPQLSYISLSHS